MQRFHAESAVSACSAALRRSGCVLLAPTETVYGLLCAWDDSAARDRIYELKQRPKSKLLAAFLPDLTFLNRFVRGPVPETALRFAARFMPGPVTLVIPDGAGGTFGFRIPDHPFILALLKEYGAPLASTSANRSGEPAALSVSGALASLAGEPDVAVDGGAIPAGAMASTVIQVQADGAWSVLRPGPVPEAVLRAVLADQPEQTQTLHVLRP